MPMTARGSAFLKSSKKKPTFKLRGGPRIKTSNRGGHRWLHRGMVRTGLQYDATVIDRQNEDWIVSATDPTELTSSHLSLLQARSRDLARNAPPFIAAIQAIVDMVVDANDGVRIQPKCFEDDAGEKPATKLIRQLKDLWEEVSEGIDADARQNIAMLVREVVREWVEVGEVFVVETLDPDPERALPVCWRIVPAERCDHTFMRTRGPNQNRITNGIEFNAKGKRVAYHFFTIDEDGLQTMDRERVDARLVRHVFHRVRAGQERGLPWLYGATLLCHDLDDFISDELTSAHVATMLTGFIKRNTPGLFGENAERDPETDRPIARFEAGAIFDLGTDEDVQMNKPDRPGGMFLPFANFILRCIGKTLGISFERLSGNYEGVNFASGRLAHLVERETTRRIQADLIQLLIKPIWKSFVKFAIAAGRVVATVDQYLANPRKFTKARFIPKGADYQDVLKEVTAAGVAVSMSMSTLEIECDKRGIDYQECIEQRGREIKMCQDAGVPVVTIGGAQVVTGQGDGFPGFTPATDPASGGDPAKATAGNRMRPFMHHVIDGNALSRMVADCAAAAGGGGGGGNGNGIH